VERITSDIDEEIFSDRAENGAFGVDLSQIPIRLWLRHLERRSPFPQEPANSVEFGLGLFPLFEQRAEDKRREDQERTNEILPAFCRSTDGFGEGEPEREVLHIRGWTMVLPTRGRKVIEQRAFILLGLTLGAFVLLRV